MQAQTPLTTAQRSQRLDPLTREQALDALLGYERFVARGQRLPLGYEADLWQYVEDFPARLRHAIIEEDATPMDQGGRGKYDRGGREHLYLLTTLGRAQKLLDPTDMMWASVECEPEWCEVCEEPIEPDAEATAYWGDMGPTDYMGPPEPVLIPAHARCLARNERLLKLQVKPGQCRTCAQVEGEHHMKGCPEDPAAPPPEDEWGQRSAEWTAAVQREAELRAGRQANGPAFGR
jgi:hypothetical protein